MIQNNIEKYKGDLVRHVGKALSITEKLLSIYEPLLIPYYKGALKWGFCSPDKTILIECKYMEIYFFSEDLACVQNCFDWYTEDKKWGYINRKGETVIPFIYELATSFTNGLAKVMNKDGKWGLINILGNTILDLQYDEIGDFYGDYATVMLNSKFGVINIYGNLIIVPKYNYICDYKLDNKFSVTLGSFMGPMGIIDLNGDDIIPVFYDVVTLNGEIGIAIKGNKWGLINKKGENLTPLIYDSISNFSEGLASVRLK